MIVLEDKMLNKKSLYNMVYAIAFVGVVLSCIGILNEFLNISQLGGVKIINTITIKKETFFVPFFFYLFAFVISAISIAFIVLNLFGVLKINKKIVNITILVSCVVLFISSFVLLFFFREYIERSDLYQINYFDYLIYYTFRSGIMSYIANMGIILTCNIIDSKCKEKVCDE
jgi:hypothetical protein